MRRTEKWTVTILLVCLVLMTLLAACQTNDPEQSTDSPEGTGEQSGETSLEDEEPFYGEVSVKRAKQLLLSIPAGESGGGGIIKYNAGLAKQEMMDFCVEDGSISIYDKPVNRQIVIYRDGKYSYIKISRSVIGDDPIVQYISGMISVIDNNKKITCLYGMDGKMRKLLRHPEEFADQVAELMEISDDSAVCRLESGAMYRCGWTDGTYAEITDWAETTEPAEYDVSLDEAAGTAIIRKWLENGGYLYTLVDTSDWYIKSDQCLYVSDEGIAYLMECLKDSVVISQIVLEEKVAVATGPLEGISSSRPTAGQETSGGSSKPTSGQQTLPGTSVVVKTDPVVVPVLQRTIPVPRDKYVYRVDGVYMDWNGDLVSLECTEWMVITDKNYGTEENVSRLIMESPEEIAPHILYCLETVESREAVSLTLLMSPVFSYADEHLTETGIVRRINPDYMLINEFGSYRPVAGRPTEEDMMQAIPYEVWNETIFADAPEQTYLYEYIENDPNGSFYGVVKGDLNFRPVFAESDPYADTLVNENWWNRYMEALETLRADPERYRYSEQDEAALLKVVEDRYATLKGDRDMPEMVRAYVDQELEIHLRAAMYANSWDADGAASLEDRAIVFQEWPEGQRSFVECIRTADGTGYAISGSGSDYWRESFEPVRKYLAQSYSELEFVTEVEYHLEDNPDYWRISGPEIRQEGDSYIIKGDKVFGGLVLLTEEQLAALDRGAAIKLMYQGEEVDRLTSQIYEFGKSYQWSSYRLANSGYVWPCLITTDDNMGDQYDYMMEKLKESPYNGSGYYLSMGEPWYWVSDVVVETDCEWTVSKDVEFYSGMFISYHNHGQGADEKWTTERFYQEAVLKKGYAFPDYSSLNVYAENGAIVKILEPYTP